MLKGRIHIPILLVFLALPLFGADHLFYANSPAWKSELVSIARTDVVIDGGQLFPPRTIPAGSETVTRLGDPGFGVVDALTPTSGELRQWTEASFNDGQSTNSVEIPPLSDALGASGFYSFEAIRNGNGRSTFVAFVPVSGTPSAVIDYYDGNNKRVGSEQIDVSAFTFYKLTLPLTIGRIEIRNVASKLGAPGLTAGTFYAVAFVGRDSGKPRVEVPTLHE